MNTTSVLDQIAHRSQTRRARDLAFSLLLAAVTAFSIGSITTAAARAHAAAPQALPEATQVVVLDDSCALDVNC